MLGSNTHMRTAYIDGLRVVASIFVVLVHTSSARVVQYAELVDSEWLSALYVDAFSRFPVPLFIMISGILILRPNRDIPLKEFYKKRLSRILIPLLFWTAFSFFWANWYYGDSVDVEFVVSSLKGALNNSHYYYLYVILGLYLIAPFLIFFLKKSKGGFALLTIAVMALSINGKIFEFLPFNAFTFIFSFLMYFMLGRYLGVLLIKPWMALLGLVAYILVSLLMVLGTQEQYLELSQNDYLLEYYLNYQHFYVFIQSIAVFVFLRYILESLSDDSTVIRLLSYVAPATFGVYLMHVPLLDFIRDVFNTLNLSNVLSDIFFESIVAYLVTLVIVLFILRIKYLRRLIS